MAPRARNNCGKVKAIEVPENSNNVVETPQGMLLAMREVMKEINQHRTEMATQLNSINGHRTEPTPTSQTEPNPYQAEATPPLVQPELTSKTTERSMTDKLAKFKKFAPTPFKEAKTPEEAEEWLSELERIMTTLRTEEEDMIPYAEFLLQGEASEWWKIEKENFKGINLTWKDFREMFLHNYFPTSVWEQKEQEFLYLKQGNLSVMQYNREFRKLARFAPSLVAAEKDRMKRFLNGLRPIMQKDLSTSKFLTHVELLDTALKLERGYNQLHAYHNQGEKKRVSIEN